MLDRHHGYIEDPVSEMSWWKAFDEDSDDGDDPFEDDPWDEPHVPYVREAPKIGRNDPCPCGSGKKYKKCHGAG
jgi:preprotein translocase subunit SecA